MIRDAVEAPIIERRLKLIRVFSGPQKYAEQPGRVRKSHPYGAHAPNQHCSICEIEREEKRRNKRRERYAGRRAEREWREI